MGIILQFFTGMYFPIDYLPTYLQQIGRVIPMTYAAQAIRDVMIRNATLSDISLPLTTLSITALGLYAVGVLLYKRWVQKWRLGPVSTENTQGQCSCDNVCSSAWIQKVTRLPKLQIKSPKTSLSIRSFKPSKVQNLFSSR